MTVKQWLSRAREADGEVERLLAMRSNAWAAAVRVVSVLDGVGRRPKQDAHRFESLAALDEEVSRELERANAAKAEALRAIGALADPQQRKVLRAYYVDCRLPDGRRKTWEMVAVELSMSWRSLMRLHAAALRALEDARPRPPWENWH